MSKKGIRHPRAAPSFPPMVEPSPGGSYNTAFRVEQPHYNVNCRYTRAVERGQGYLVMRCVCQANQQRKEPHGSACHYIQWFDESRRIFFHVGKCRCPK